MPWGGECRKMDERIRPDLRSFPPVIFHPESAKLRACVRYQGSPPGNIE